jgi:hypothetical protein
VAGLELAAPAVDGLVLADGELDGLGLADGELDGLGLAGGELDGPGVAPGGPDVLRPDGLDVDGLGRAVRLAHAPELLPVTLAAAPCWPARSAVATVWLDGLALGPAGDALVGLGLGLTVGNELLGLGLAGGGLVELWLTLGDELAGAELAGLGLAGLGAGPATAGVDGAQAAAGCP